MNYETVTKEEFNVIGIAVRTINKNGKAQQDIGKLYARFFGQNILAQIPDKASPEIYCIYTEYESDFNGAYTTILGCKVHSLDTIPNGFVGKTIPTTTYKVFKAKGKLPECVGATWNDIWQSGMERKYIADFDVYGEKAQNPVNAEVDIYIS